MHRPSSNKNSNEEEVKKSDEHFSGIYHNKHRSACEQNASK
jgi:hypothetical protein